VPERLSNVGTARGAHAGPAWFNISESGRPRGGGVGRSDPLMRAPLGVGVVAPSQQRRARKSLGQDRLAAAFCGVGSTSGVFAPSLYVLDAVIRAKRRDALVAGTRFGAAVKIPDAASNRLGAVAL